MHRLDAYLKTIAQLLPAAERHDIVKELSENLLSHIEDREARLRRPLTDAEIEALARDFGSPLEVAGRYRQDTRVLAFGRILVGPVLFPFYAKVLAFNLGITAAAITIVAAVLRTQFTNLPQTLLVHLSIQFGIVTVIFSLAEMGLGSRHESFRAAYQALLTPPSRGSDHSRVSRLGSLSQIVALVVLLAWLPAFGNAARGALAEIGLALAPAWHAVYVTLACLWGAGIVQAAINVVRPQWTRVYWVTRAASDLAWLVMVTALLGAGAWVVPLGTGVSSPAVSRVAHGVSHGIFVSLVVTAVISAIVVFFDLRRLAGLERGRRGGSSGRASSTAEEHRT